MRVMVRPVRHPGFGAARMPEGWLAGNISWLESFLGEKFGQSNLYNILLLDLLPMRVFAKPPLKRKWQSG